KPHRIYQLNTLYSELANDSGVNQTRIRVLECPASAAVAPAENHRGITDYAATCGVDRFIANPFMNPIPPLEDSFLGVLGRNVSRKLSAITDGASNTLMVAEDAGHTEIWQMGKKLGPVPVDGQGAWANPRTHLLIAAF